MVHVVDDDGALPTYGFHRAGKLAAQVRDRLTTLSRCPLERSQPLRLEIAQQFAAFRGKRQGDRVDRTFPLDGHRAHDQVSLPTQFVEDDLSLVRDQRRKAFGA